MTDIFTRLAAPFPPDRVSWRVGPTSKDKSKGMALAYVDARDVMDRLDEVCGPHGWQDRYPHAGTKTVCEIGIKVGDEWLWKADGAGDTDTEAEKGALSSAFKRSAVKWGIGRYLYDVQSPWVQIDEFRQIKKEELPRLRQLLAKGAPVAVAPPPPPPPSRPIPPEVVNSADAPSSMFRRMADELIAVGKAARTEADLDEWKADVNTKKTFRDIPPEEQERVTNELAKHRQSIRKAA